MRHHVLKRHLRTESCVREIQPQPRLHLTVADIPIYHTEKEKWKLGPGGNKHRGKTRSSRCAETAAHRLPPWLHAAPCRAESLLKPDSKKTGKGTRSGGSGRRRGRRGREVKRNGETHRAAVVPGGVGLLNRGSVVYVAKVALGPDRARQTLENVHPV